MFIHYKKTKDELSVGKVVKQIPVGRTLYQTQDGTSMQIEDSKIVKTLENACWRCWGTKRVFAPNSNLFFDCPACKYNKEKNET